MRLYHWRFPILLVLGLILAGCFAPRRSVSSSQPLTVSIQADGKAMQLQVPAGSTVQDALTAANLTQGSLDRCEPAIYTVLTEGAKIHLVRVREEFETETVTIPYELQRVKSESLPDGQTLLSQQGVNGEQEITYRRLFEDGSEISTEELKRVTLIEALPEITVVGIQQMFSPSPIPGRLVYLLGGNAWVMENNTGKRRLVVSGGDLDGYIFTLSPDGTWLLFTRRSTESGKINNLWAAQIDLNKPLLVDLKVANVIYFAEWMPGAVRTLAYSTVTQQAAPPGWHTNNDLHILTIEGNQPGQSTPVELTTSMIGTYPWWGISFAWSPDGTRFAYANDHQVGILTNLSKGNPQPLLNFPHLQTGSEWAWVPGIAWGPDGKILYCVDHVPQTGATSIEESQFFDLTAIPLTGGLPVHLASQVGMFAYPSPSPIYTLPSGEAAYQLAYMQAIVAAQSQTSRYRLWVMDRDGSNPQAIFPDEGARGLDPQRVVWSPAPVEELGGQAIAVVYQGNIWFISTTGAPPRQITGDGVMKDAPRIDWK